MRINEILVESQQLDEGPLMNKIGTAVGKAAGTAAKGIGAVAGGAVGAWDAMKKGFAAGKATVGAGGDDEEPAATQKGGGVGAQPSAQDVNKAGPAGTAPATNLTGTAKAAADKTAAATQDQNAAQAGQTVYSQVKANIDKLDKKGKQRILQLLQKSIQQAPAQPAADAGSAAMGQMAKQLSTPSKSSTGGTITQTPTGMKHTAKQAAPAAAVPATAAKPGLKIAGKKGTKPSPFPTAQTASKENLGNMIAEGFSLYRKK